MFIGAAGSLVSNLVVRVWPRSAIDDALDVFPCHGIGGMTGMVLVGIFAEEDGLLTGNVQGFATDSRSWREYPRSRLWGVAIVPSHQHLDPPQSERGRRAHRARSEPTRRNALQYRPRWLVRGGQRGGPVEKRMVRAWEHDGRRQPQPLINLVRVARR